MGNETLEEVLEERGERYGPILIEAEISQTIQDLLEREQPTRFTNVQRHAIRMIAVKLARISNGDPDYVDNWKDIAGYATLVMGDLERTYGK